MVRGSFSKLMLFSSVLGWWMPVAEVGFCVPRSQPAYATFQEASGTEFSSTSVKSEALDSARKVLPVRNCEKRAAAAGRRSGC
ncbi:MAG: hypothetical protein IPI34_14790 [bacterium]|nr:hypothetical protein [bacterium]